jgi:hypothetical protein
MRTRLAERLRSDRTLGLTVARKILEELRAKAATLPAREDS